MFYIGYYKGSPSNYIMKVKNGKIKREGKGISFFYNKKATSIIVIPANTIDAYFVFNEITNNFQTVSIQGQLTYRISDYRKMYESLDFSINPYTKQYVSKSLETLSNRIINAIKMTTKQEIKDLSLEETLISPQKIAANIIKDIKNNEDLKNMGIECLSIYLTSISPTPELAKALEAEYREKLQKKADEAIYSRRAAAVEQEKKIKENELNSQIYIETKNKELVELKGQNILFKGSRI